MSKSWFNLIVTENWPYGCVSVLRALIVIENNLLRIKLEWFAFFLSVCEEYGSTWAENISFVECNSIETFMSLNKFWFHDSMIFLLNMFSLEIIMEMNLINNHLNDKKGIVQHAFIYPIEMNLFFHI